MPGGIKDQTYYEVTSECARRCVPYRIRPLDVVALLHARPVVYHAVIVSVDVSDLAILAFAPGISLKNATLDQSGKGIAVTLRAVLTADDLLQLFHR